MKWFLALSVLAASCAADRPAKYPFNVRYVANLPGDGLDPGELAPEQFAMLLVPKGVAAAEGRTSPDAGARPLLRNGGGLRVVPGLRTLSFTAKTTHEDGEEGRASWTVTQAFSRGKAYELRVEESDAKLDWTLNAISADEYRRHAIARMPELPLVRPIEAPFLPLGLQADGSTVVSGEEQHGIPPMQISAPLFECPSPSAGIAESTLTVFHLAQACAADDPDLTLDGAQGSWGFDRIMRFAGAAAACAEVRFGSARRWKHPSLHPELCARVLGGDWRMATTAEARQISYLAKTARSEDGKSPSPLDIIGALYATRRYGIDVVIIENSDGASGWDEHRVSELRCVRSPMSVTPAQTAPGRCPPRTSSASDSADSRPSPPGPR